MSLRGLTGLRVIEWATGIAGPYTGKLLADAGADVIKIEPVGGDPLRRWTASGADLGDSEGGLFRYLNGSKRSVIGEISSSNSGSVCGPAKASFVTCTRE